MRSRLRGSILTALKMKGWLIILVLTLFPASLRADLRWERVRAELAPGPNDKTIEARFAFMNDGKAAVTIESVKSSCDCTTAAIDRKTYGPGEKGELRTLFDIGQRRGLQTKTIEVKVQGQPVPTILTLVVTIADLVQLTPALVMWAKGEANKAKEISIKAQPGQTIRALKVTSSNPRMRTKVETLKEGEAYVLSVTPEATDAAGFAILTIDAELLGQTKILKAYAHVKDAAQ